MYLKTYPVTDGRYLVAPSEIELSYAVVDGKIDLTKIAKVELRQAAILPTAQAAKTYAKAMALNSWGADMENTASADMDEILDNRCIARGGKIYVYDASTYKPLSTVLNNSSKGGMQLLLMDIAKQAADTHAFLQKMRQGNV